MDNFEIIVIGGGHAGVEAAYACARLKKRTCLVTNSYEDLGKMSCNPAIGGIGKSHLVREIDAMGGLMALAADAAGIHFRVLNASKGPAVRATRSQSDRLLYSNKVKEIISSEHLLTIREGEVSEIILENEKAKVKEFELKLPLLNLIKNTIEIQRKEEEEAKNVTKKEKRKKDLKENSSAE